MFKVGCQEKKMIATSMLTDFNPRGKEYRTKGANLVPIGGKLPYFLELPTGKILDIFVNLFKDKLSGDRKTARQKINQWLYPRTRPSFYMELNDKLHLAYAHQKDGHGTQHYWRLFFDDNLKNHIESIIHSTALVVGKETPASDGNNCQSYSEGLKEWGGMYFRSEAEIALAEELHNRGLMFFANVRGMVNTEFSPVSQGQSSGRLEVDFLVFHKGQCISIEVDGNHHQENDQIRRDYSRDRLLLKEQISTARFTAQECYEHTQLVVREIINLFP